MALCKVVFTSPQNPNMGSRIIMAAEKSPWTHVVYVTSVVTPSGEPLCLDAHARAGLQLSPLSLAVGFFKDTKTYTFDAREDWNELMELLRKYRGFRNYGWPQIMGMGLQILKIPRPSWLRNLYDGRMHCSGYIIRLAQKRGLLQHMNPAKDGPGTLEKEMQQNPNFVHTEWII